jgi:hypothetical protein
MIQSIDRVRGTDNEQLLRVRRGGGVSTLLLDALHVLDSLVLDDGRLYWLDKRAGEDSVRLMSAAVSGEAGSNELWVRGHVTSGPLIAGGKVYWLEQEATFWRANLDGSHATKLASTEHEGERVRVMASDGEHFYLGWSSDDASGVSVYNADSGRIERIGTDAHNDSGIPVALAVDDKTL